VARMHFLPLGGSSATQVARERGGLRGLPGGDTGARAPFRALPRPTAPFRALPRRSAALEKRAHTFPPFPLLFPVERARRLRTGATLGARKCVAGCHRQGRLRSSLAFLQAPERRWLLIACEILTLTPSAETLTPSGVLSSRGARMEATAAVLAAEGTAGEAPALSPLGLNRGSREHSTSVLPQTVVHRGLTSSSPDADASAASAAGVHPGLAGLPDDLTVAILRRAPRPLQ